MLPTTEGDDHDLYLSLKPLPMLNSNMGLSSRERGVLSRRALVKSRFLFSAAGRPDEGKICFPVVPRCVGRRAVCIKISFALFHCCMKPCSVHPDQLAARHGPCRTTSWQQGMARQLLRTPLCWKTCDCNMKSRFLFSAASRSYESKISFP